jgi:tripartite motif-containing protein 71
MIKNINSFCGTDSIGTVAAPPSRRIPAAALTALAVCLLLGLGATPAPAFQYVPLSHFGSSGSEAGELENPQGIAVDQTTHDVYVADAGNHRIEKFDESGAFIAAWGWGVLDGGAQSEVCTGGCQAGQAGGGVGQLYTPIVIAVDNSEGSSKGDVYVGDSENHRVEKFTSAGTYISSLSYGSSGEFGSVMGVADDANGNVWVYDVNAEVYEFKDDGSEIQQWNTNYGGSPGFTVDASSNVYAVRGYPVIEKFSGSGSDRGEFDPANATTTGVAFDPASDSIFSDQGGFVAKYDARTALPASPSTTFGQEVLHGGTGVGVDGTSGAVYVAASASNQIFVFGPPPPGPPIVEDASVKEVSSNSAQLDAKVYKGQIDTKYYFE